MMGHSPPEFAIDQAIARAGLSNSGRDHAALAFFAIGLAARGSVFAFAFTSAA
jgi:hypothetical protein